MIAINVAWYYMVTSSALKELNDKRKSDRITWKERIGKISLWATRLHNSDTIDVAPLIQLNEQIMLNDEDTTMKRVKSTKLQQLPNQMIYLIISFVVEDISLFPKLFIVFNNFNRALASTSSFFNEWQTMQDDLQKVDDFWAEKTFCEKPEQRQLSKTVEKITIKHGDHIRIIGPTGSGKTTFAKGIFGWLSGLSMDGMSDLLAFNDDIAMMRQNIREITPFEKTTIRQLFYDEKDDAKINDRLAETNADTWVRTIMKGDLDKLIGNKISGGQKTQICLAITLYKMHKNRSNWLILDEPEQGVDTEQVPDILRKIFEKYSEKTILIITHMCDCQIRQLGILKTINVENKTITSNF